MANLYEPLAPDQAGGPPPPPISAPKAAPLPQGNKVNNPLPLARKKPSNPGPSPSPAASPQVKSQRQPGSQSNMEGTSAAAGPGDSNGEVDVDLDDKGSGKFGVLSVQIMNPTTVTTGKTSRNNVKFYCMIMNGIFAVLFLFLSITMSVFVFARSSEDD